MPNHAFNKLTLSCSKKERLEELMEFVKDDTVGKVWAYSYC